MGKSHLVIVACGLFTACASSGQFPDARMQGCDNEELSPAFKIELGKALAYISENAKPTDAVYRQAIRIIEDTLKSDLQRCPYDQARAYELLGSYRAQLTPPDYFTAAEAYKKALNFNALPEQRQMQIMYFVAQLDFYYERYEEVIVRLRELISRQQANGADINANTWILLGAAYVATDNYADAREPMETALALHEAEVAKGERRRSKSYYDILNAIYTQLCLPAEREELLGRMVEFYPAEERYKRQLEQLGSSPAGPCDQEVPPQIGNGESFSGNVPNRDALPPVRIPPRYPNKCVNSKKGVELRGEVWFDVTPEGQTENIRVVNSDDDCLNEYAIGAVRLWKYAPKRVNGRYIPRKNVRTTFIFILEDDLQKEATE